MKRAVITLGVFMMLLTLGCTDSRWGTACFGEECFRVELAETPDQWTRGLMYREHLGVDEGMLLVLEGERIFSEWMKNMLIPLDVLWLDEDGRVLYIAGNLQPCGPDYCESVTPDVRAKYILELNAGTVERIGLEVGDTFSIDLG